MTTKFVGVKEFRQNMAKIVKRSRKKNERIIVLRRNQPLFEIKPISEEDILLEEFESDIREALEDIKAGRTYSQEEVEKMLGL